MLRWIYSFFFFFFIYFFFLDTNLHLLSALSENTDLFTTWWNKTNKVIFIERQWLMFIDYNMSIIKNIKLAVESGNIRLTQELINNKFIPFHNLLISEIEIGKKNGNYDFLYLREPVAHAIKEYNRLLRWLYVEAAKQNIRIDIPDDKLYLNDLYTF